MPLIQTTFDYLGLSSFCIFEYLNSFHGYFSFCLLHLSQDLSTKGKSFQFIKDLSSFISLEDVVINHFLGARYIRLICQNFVIRRSICRLHVNKIKHNLTQTKAVYAISCLFNPDNILLKDPIYQDLQKRFFAPFFRFLILI